ncbi:putative secreted protein [Streptomyces gancidicus BKS 13-15]|uniref:Putative secreted protein n=1 Tax=Streptomyces gancidicus BKS 13-15 TaxID=1284664 RepID=M3EBI4_STREZ|nr:putative secreted protein [Streptomyces gancidicus BKS 13-15]
MQRALLEGRDPVRQVTVSGVEGQVWLPTLKVTWVGPVGASSVALTQTHMTVPAVPWDAGIGALRAAGERRRYPLGPHRPPDRAYGGGACAAWSCGTGVTLQYIRGARGLGIDHLVRLAEVWDAGASVWSVAERKAYTTDLGDDRALIAVSAASNRSKADQDPTTRLPPATAASMSPTGWPTRPGGA